ncbi:hypothetical protein FN846DRAFT_781169 [Sphaerosporella brunnea]|uniref:S1-like domain-containing protein n=1 Tax=Sphaerosporella brunnea TaxID=1250544 RepID=A0A5J5ERA3_9PEZI|nr:hypothetical protein FN846DRAFT_781169 [Sphaerosporella brunnea]
MPPRKSSKRALSALDELTSVPPDSPLPPSQVIGRIAQAQGKNLFTCSLPSGESILAELAPIFRGTAWLRRGGYVLIDTTTFDARDNKIGGQVINVVRNEREWRKMDYWPAEFASKDLGPGDSEEEEEEEESTVGKLPPNSDDEEQIT